MKIVLIRPPETNRIWAGIPKFFNKDIFLFPPLGLMQLKSFIEQNTKHEVIIYDSLIRKATYRTIAKFIEKIKPQVVGISAFTHSLSDVVNTAWAIKEADSSIHISVGGPHTYNFFSESSYLIKNWPVDSVVLGDGEIAFKKIISALEKRESFENINSIIFKDRNGKIVRNGVPAFIDNLDSLPFPSRLIPGFKRYYTPASSGGLMTTMITSRGCPYDCKFCNVQRKYRVRSIGNVVDEMELCSRLGCNEIFFIDDTFNVTADRVIGLSEEILKRGLKIKWGFKARCDNIDIKMLTIAEKAGCFRIHYGIETGLDSGLSSINKKLTLDAAVSAFINTRKLGVRATAYFIIGCPHEKSAFDIMETIDFACRLKADFAVFSLLSPYPDTEFYREGVEKGVIDRRLWDDFIKNPVSKSRLPTCWEEYFTKRDLVCFLKTAHRNFYYRWHIIFHAFFSVFSFKEFIRLVRGAVSLSKLEFLGTNNRDF
ncbi:MAG: radical SAM protein [Candidatus Omnitrophica bacterium]|nr:radical SAM protein [Candidatus Omnitrophota bacterium]